MSRFLQHHEEYLHELWYKITRDQDRQAYSQFFDYFYPRLFRFSLQFVKLPHMAEEVVSDVIYGVLKDRLRMSSIGNISGYLYKSVKNKSLNRVNRQGYALKTQSIEELEDYIVQEPLTQEVNSNGQDVFQLLSAIVNQLPKQRQAVYRLIREEGLNVNEVSQILSISERTIEKHLELAIKDICIELKAYIKDQRHHPRIRKMFPRSFLLFF